MKKFSLILTAFLSLGMFFSSQVNAQGRIDLNTTGAKAQGAQNVTMSGFSTTISYSSIESTKVNTEKGTFSVISMGNSVAAGNIGAPQVPVTRELIAVPFGANPVVNVKSYTVTDYKLSDYGIERLYPQQPSQSKSEKEVKFVYNEAAYAAKGFDEARPIAEVNVMGTMRGIQIGALQVNALRYNAATNTVRVYNDIELEVNFEDADLEYTEKTLVNTYSPYFRTVYSSLYNNRAINDVYDEHPDLWAAPVKVLVVANRMFEESMQPWLEWKTEKGFYLDVNYTDEIGTTAEAIKSFIHNKYNEGVAAGQAPTFLIIFGDKNQVPAAQTGTETHCVTDLYYYTCDGDVFGDMYHSRFTAETVAEMDIMIHKSLQYEQYTMPDPSYLSNVLLVAGWDSSWNPKDGKPTIQYAMNYYYNEEHGFENVYAFLEQPYNNPYASMNTGVGFVNYTAHGSNTSWADPSFTNSDVNQLTNTDKYFWAMGNCCQAADWGISGKCLGEAFVIAPNKGAFAYIGSCPSSYWYEDYYFGVGATHTFYAPPTYEESSMGVYDATFQDDFNSLSAVPFVGNLAVAYAHANGYDSSVTDRYYWESYHVLGDGSICTFHVNPTENDVTHLPTLPIGMDFYTVSAAPGSYVGISKDGVLYGAGEIGESGTADIPMTPVTSGGTAKIVVTHPQRIPYVAEVPAASMEGPYIAVDGYTPTNVPCNEEQSMSISFKNVGADPTTGTTNVTISCEDENLTIIDGEGSFDALGVDGTVTLENEFSFIVAEGVADNTKIIVNVEATCGSDTWNGKAVITVGAPIIEFLSFQTTPGFEPGESQPVMVTFKNKGHYKALNAVVTATSESEYLSIEDNVYEVGTIEAGGIGVAMFTANVAAGCPETEQLAMSFELTAENAAASTGAGVLKNACNVLFELHDSYGDGWNGAALNVAFSDGSPAQSLTIGSGNSATYTLEIGTGVGVTLSWTSGSWDSECSFDVKYDDGTLIYSGTANASYQFICTCGSGGASSVLDPVENLNAEVNVNNITLTWDVPQDALSTTIMCNGIVIAENLNGDSYDVEVPNEDTYNFCVYANYEEGQSMPECITVFIDLGVEESEVNFNIYPNPANSSLFINGGNAEYSYVMYNGMGQVVANGTAQGTQQINVSDMSKGVYFIRLTSGTQNTIQKVVVE